jgi:thiol-disulfide isomerase/thioredoxin
VSGRPFVLLVLLVPGLALALSACGMHPAPPAAHGSDPAVGLTVFTASARSRLPTLSGPTLTGRSLSASAYAAGAPLVINVWASWCSPCRQEIPLLARAARLGVRVLGIDERDSVDRARSFAADRHASYPSLSDPRGRLLGSLHPLPQTGIPSTLVVAPDGTVAARVIGPLTSATLRRALAAVAS